MALNWVEEIVGQYYQAKGYLVVYDVDLPMPKTDSRSVRGHSDIDVLAINNIEVVHVECQSWWGPGKASEQKELKRLKDRFEVAPDVIHAKYPFLYGRKIVNRFVTTGKPKRLGTNGPWSRLQTFCSNNKITLVEVNTILWELVSLIRQKYPETDRVGKEPSLTRFLLHLIHNGFINEATEQGAALDDYSAGKSSGI
ncbi:MAG TPA: hypothetical protein PKW17_13730 [Smithellaceae bacterium]|jgi:hypothetical protein|nr:hypothetical protein [Smithellaceae bacterium]HRS90377.1 hypothetical protein [Smithellaceae bacterium]